MVKGDPRSSYPAVARPRVVGFQQKRTGGAYTHLRGRDQRREGIELAEDSVYRTQSISGYMRVKTERQGERGLRAGIE